MDLRHEIIMIIFHNEGFDEGSDNLTIASKEFDQVIQNSIQAKIEQHMKESGQETFLENVKSAIDLFKWAEVIIRKKSIEIQFSGMEKETNNDINLFIDLDSYGIIKNYDVEVYK